MSPARYLAALLLILGISIFCPPSPAQLPNVTGATITPTPGVGHDYLKMLNETVDPASGALSLRIAIPVPPGRGLTLPFAFTYDSNSSTLLQTNPGAVGWSYAKGLFEGGAWSNTLPQLTANLQQYLIPNTASACYSSVGYMFQDSNGSRHSLRVSAVISNTNPNINPACQYTNWSQQLSGGDDFVQANLLGIGNGAGNYNSYGAGVGSVQIADAHGTVYTFADSQFPGSGEWNCSSVAISGPQVVQGLSFSMPSKIEDTNGNTITISNPCGASTFSISDTTGRPALTFQTNWYTINSHINSVTVSGETTPYTVGAFTATGNPGSVSVNSTTIFDSGGCGLVPNVSGTPGHSSISLPNGQSYQFSYDGTYGFINKITFPSGGYISYTWGLNPKSAVVSFTSQQGQKGGCVDVYDKPAITHRYVSYDGTTIALQQDFSYSTSPITSSSQFWTTKQTVVTTHDLIRGTSYATTYSYTPIYIGALPNATTPTSPFVVSAENEIPVESSIVYKDFSGKTLKTVTKGWADQYTLSCELETLDNGAISGKYYGYGPGHVPTDIKEFDFGQLTAATCNSNATPAREKSTTIQNFPPTPLFPSAASIFDRPQSVSIYSNGALAAQTVYSYDQVSVASVANLPSGTHDETNYGSGSSSPRGNATTVTRKCLQSCTDSTTTYTFDETGQVLTQKDPCGNAACSNITGTNHTTTYSYADNYDSNPTSSTNAYLTKVTDPLGHITSYKYAYADGQLISSTDQNSLVTNYLYADFMRRLTETDRPDGGSTVLSYNDTPPTPSLTTATKINTTTTETTVAIKDGMGHFTHSQLTSDPQGTVYTDTAYDGLGLVYTVSNPYRSGSDPTSSPGTTTYVYDALGRKLTQTYPDNSVLTTAYCGPNTLVTDPSKRWRRSRSDAFGRLVEVDEPNAVGATDNSNACPGTGEPIWITSYTLNALNDLTNVVQNGSHQRSFTYDSLSRLLTSTNPEVGTLTYTYDANGNVLTKKDARAITTTYGYDALNRELTRTYSDGTPTVTTTYDQTTCVGLPGMTCQNIGHRTSMTDAAGSESWAYKENNQTLDRPHILVDQRTTGGVTKTGTYYSDMAGNITQWVYPTGRTMYTAISAANRMVEVYNGPAYAAAQYPASPGCPINIVCYTPQGTIYSMSLYHSSTFNGLNILETYNSRLQPQEIKASSTGGNAMDISYSYTDPVNGGNAGHVFSITHNLNNSRTQNFTYDQLNRITSAGTFATTGGNCWGYQYTYDAWANLTSQSGWTPNYNGCSQTVMAPVTADANNHISAFSYDAAGNATGETGFTYTWDAESQLKTDGTFTFGYDGDGRRVSGVSYYWYGPNGEILGTTDGSGTTEEEYVYLGGRRLAAISGTRVRLYASDSLGSARVITDDTGAVYYDADFTPFGGERAYKFSYPTIFKFEGKIRDYETGNDDFGARYYSNRFGRWLSADWSNVPTPVPYANLTNPQTLNLYSMVADDPESFADLDGHLDPQYNCNNNGAICTGGMFEKDENQQAIVGQTPTQQSAQNQNQTQTQQNQQTQQQPQQPSAASVGVLALPILARAGVGALEGGEAGGAAGTVEPGGGNVVGALAGAAIGGAVAALAPTIYSQSKEALKKVGSQLERALDHVGKLNGPDQNPNPRGGWKQTIRDAANQIDKQAGRISNQNLSNAARFTAQLLRGLVD